MNRLTLHRAEYEWWLDKPHSQTKDNRQILVLLEGQRLLGEIKRICGEWKEQQKERP